MTTRYPFPNILSLPPRRTFAARQQEIRDRADRMADDLRWFVADYQRMEAELEQVRQQLAEAQAEIARLRGLQP